jgi:archaellum component FlaF (FlaF/FlaG flagellin family)
MGKLGRKSKISGKVTITNKGKGVLRLESIEVYNQALKVSLPKRSLVPGESMKMKVTLQAKYLGMSNAQPRVLIITNDADHQKETITVKFVK